MTSRTCAMPPGAPSISGEATVCTESRMRSDGFTASKWPSTAARSVSAARYRWSSMALMRSARIRTWLADSSPVTYSVRCSSLADLAATSSSSVDLPTPGSPASSTTAPGTSPPPSTRSSSGTPVERAVACSAVDLADGHRGRGHSARSRRTDRGRAVLLDRPPGLALGAAAEPLGRLPAALLAAVGRTVLGGLGTGSHVENRNRRH